MQSPGPGLNTPVGSTVPVVVPIPVYQQLTQNYITSVGQQASAVPTVVTAATYAPLQTQTTPGASLGPAPIVIQSIPAGSAAIQYGSSVPIVESVPQFQPLTNNYITTVGQQASVVPAVVTTPSYSLLETQTTPGANLTPSQPVITAIPAGLIPSAPQPSAVPQVNVQPTYKALGSQTTAGVSLLPVFTQSQAIGPLANYVNKDTPFWSLSGTSGGAGFTSTFSTLYASSFTANFASISTLQNSTIITTSINIDGQTLDADSNQLFLNGIPIATTANLSSIADWSIYDAISTVHINNNDITGINDLFGGTLNATNVNSVVSDTSSLTFVTGQGDSLAASTINASSLTFVTGQGDSFAASTINTSSLTFVTGIGDSLSASTINASTIYVSSINTNNVSITSSPTATGTGVLTTNDSGNTLFFNGNPLAQQSQISSLADWSYFPSVSTIQANNPIYNASGRLKLQGQGIDIGALGATPSGSTNTMTINAGDISILSDGGGGFNVASGLSLAAGAGFSLAGGAGGAITTGLVLLIQAGGALGLSAAGAVTMQAAGACSMAAAGPVNIGSQAYTSLETIRIDNSLITRDTGTSDRLRIRDVQELQGNNTGGGGSGRLDIIGNGVSINMSTTAGISINAENTEASVGIPLRIRADGTTGTGLGTTFYTLEQEFNPSSQTFLYNSATTNLTGVFPPITFNRNCKNINALTTSSLTHTMSETYDGHSTITYANSLGTVNLTGITNLTAGTINTTTLNLANLSVSSIAVSSIVGNYGEFNTLRTSATQIALGLDAGSTLQGFESIAIGYQAGVSSQDSYCVAIGKNAATNNQGLTSVAIGINAGTTNQGTYCVALGNSAGLNTQGTTAIAVGVQAGQDNQAAYGTAIGYQAGITSQGTNGIAIGFRAGKLTQGEATVAIGANAGETTQQLRGTAVGFYAGNINQGASATAVGVGAGYQQQAGNSVAIGNNAGNNFLGPNSIAIGGSASLNGGNFDNTIVLNATGGTLNPAQADSCYIAPIRQTTDAEGYGSAMLRWNQLTKEVSYAPLVGSLQVVATSATAINLLPTLYGKTYVLTGTTTQNFTTTSLTINDSGWFCVVHNGNGSGGGDINMTGMTGTAIIHNRTFLQNGGDVYLFWNGTALIGY